MQNSNNAESPRAVYLACCNTIGDVFIPDGFKFARSGPHFSKRSGDHLYTVAFQSSHHNVSGEYVALWIHAYVRSTRLKKWRAENLAPYLAHDLVAGGQIGNLAKNQAWLEWDVSKRFSREKEVSSATNAIRRLALPFFDLFNDVPSVCRRLVREDLPGMHPTSSFEYLACFDSLDSARAMAVRYLAEHPDLLADHRRCLREFRQTGLPEYEPSGYAESLVVLSHKFDLGDITKG